MQATQDDGIREIRVKPSFKFSVLRHLPEYVFFCFVFYCILKERGYVRFSLKTKEQHKAPGHVQFRVTGERGMKPH